MNSLQERRIRDWMTSDPLTVSSSTTLPEAYWLMVEKNIRRLLVVDKDRLVGIVTMDDLRGSFHTEIIAINPLKVNEMLSELPVRQLMSKNPMTIAPTASVVEAARKMLKHKISTLPVMDSGKIVGIITESDLFRVLVDICIGEEQ
ncbi:MAG: CBS domain-containing protein [Chloroflexota bacterium]|nr:CBS domain-containing protein [Chloroflexota bacterium]